MLTASNGTAVTSWFGKAAGHGVGVDRFHTEVLNEQRPTAPNGVFLVLNGRERCPLLLLVLP